MRNRWLVEWSFNQSSIIIDDCCNTSADTDRSRCARDCTHATMSHTQTYIDRYTDRHSHTHTLTTGHTQTCTTNRYVGALSPHRFRLLSPEQSGRVSRCRCRDDWELPWDVQRRRSGRRERRNGVCTRTLRHYNQWVQTWSALHGTIASECKRGVHSAAL